MAGCARIHLICCRSCFTGSSAGFCSAEDCQLVEQAPRSLRKTVIKDSATKALRPNRLRAIVAMHDQPSRTWHTEDLAEISGMSRSRFMTLFPKVVGMTPATYLTSWRLTLGRRELSRGGRVKSVARRVGFGSAAAFSRPIHAHSARAQSYARLAKPFLNLKIPPML
jgi:transcriptional regulator GlxA family with amidase domain